MFIPTYYADCSKCGHVKRRMQEQMSERDCFYSFPMNREFVSRSQKGKDDEKLLKSKEKCPKCRNKNVAEHGLEDKVIQLSRHVGTLQDTIPSLQIYSASLEANLKQAHEAIRLLVSTAIGPSSPEISRIIPSLTSPSSYREREVTQASMELTRTPQDPPILPPPQTKLVRLSTSATSPPAPALFDTLSYLSTLSSLSRKSFITVSHIFDSICKDSLDGC